MNLGRLLITASKSDLSRSARPSPSPVRRMTLLLAALLPTAHAQVSASIKGIVTDVSGAAVAGATVNTRDVETGAMRGSVTDDSGRYLVLALPVGEYEVRVAKAGFQDAIRSGIYLVVGQEASVDLQLQIGTGTSELAVRSDAPIVSVSTKDISGVVGEQVIKVLPLNGRTYDLLLPLNPGIVNFTSQK